MFSSHHHLRKKTPTGGINRKEFIEHLVEEYYTSTNIEAQEQVTANLANFCYDPINWKYLKDSEALQVFLAGLSLPNETIQLHSVAGLCNICLDPVASLFITSKENLTLIQHFFQRTSNPDIILNCLALFYQLLGGGVKPAEIRQVIATPQVLRKITEIRHNSKDQRLVNLAIIFLEDFGTRTEVKITTATGNTSNVKANQKSMLSTSARQDQGN